MVVDADSGKIVAMPRIGFGPYASGLDPDTQLVFSSNGAGTLTVIHEDSPNRYTVLATLEPTGSRDTWPSIRRLTPSVQFSGRALHGGSFSKTTRTAIRSKRYPDPCRGADGSVGRKQSLCRRAGRPIGSPHGCGLTQSPIEACLTRLAEENAMKWRLLNPRIGAKLGYCRPSPGWPLTGKGRLSGASPEGYSLKMLPMRSGRGRTPS